MESLYQSEPTALDIGQFLWRHKGKFVLTAAAGMMCTLLYLSLAPRLYQSEAKLLVRIGRESITLDPTATTGQYVAVPEPRESDMHAIEELLASRATAERVVTRFGPGVILETRRSSRSMGDRLSWLNQYNLNPLRVYSLHDKAVNTLRRNLSISAGKKSNVLSVSYRAQDSQLAHDVLAALLEVVREQYLRVNRTTGSQDFFDSQLQAIRGDLAGQEQGVREFKDKNGLAALASQRDTQVTLLGSLQGDLLRANAEQSAVQAEVNLRRRQLHEQPTLIVTEQTTGQPQTARQTLRERVYELEVREQELASRLKDDAPQLAQIRKQIAESRRIMTDEQIGTETKKGISQTHQAAELALQEREAQLVALEARTATLEAKIAAGVEDLKKLNAAELQLTRLERELELARSNYRKYSENLEQARIDQELEAAKISSLNLMQPPSLSPTPISPQPLPTLALGLAGSLLSGVAVALLADRRPRRRLPTASRVASVVREAPSPMVPARARRSEIVPANPR